MALTEMEIRNAKPGAKIIKLSDGGGLQLWVSPDGAKRWRLAYRFNESQKTLAIGVYPAIGLKDAREARESAKRLLAEGEDPSQARKQAKAAQMVAAANTFAAIAEELLAKKRREGKAETTLGKLDWLLGLAMPVLGPRPVTEISSPDVLAVLRRIEARGQLETAGRLRAVVGEVFRYAIATGRAENDPTFALRGALTTPKTKHRAAIVEPVAFGALLRSIEDYEGTPEVRAALKLMALTFVRPGELRNAFWAEFDLEAGLWIIPAGRMKMRRPHRVPLAPQAVAVLKELHAITGHRALLFPGVRSADRAMSENTINAALRRLGYGKDDMTGHGFRAAASSLLNECGKWNADAIEAQLAHVESNKIRKAYARAEYWDERISMMDWWANKCDELRRGGIVVKLSA
ncbi:integrase arm-type DNA-binding domain-containing protein [uncultured Rhodoblastus sp.]|uniref:tyrosine-type recombinase/integrase n=1 Tax=uncultured Rhodoblastus sp. TaxID=543037 RepID=UPI0025DC8D11|nr:integrase arm-type DNA-binding domain-containing protein [uncultured Rhodoblastus sp.]